jgi:hypothetical protein
MTAPGSNPIGLAASDLPATWAATEAQARAAQRRYVLLMRGQILLPLVGVTVGALAASVLGIVATAAGVLTATLRLLQRSSSVETVWYESRATAEAAKSLAWRYSVRGSPFDAPDQSDEAADELFATELGKIVSDRDLIAPPDASGEVTPGMRALRASPQDVRREAYVRERVRDQLNWYSHRARRDASVADRWDTAFYVLTGIAIVAGVLLTADVDISALGPAVSLAAGSSGAVIAWVGVRRFTSLSRSYSKVASQLSMRDVVAVHKDTPEEWIAFVDDVEQILSREHEQWRSTRR